MASRQYLLLGLMTLSSLVSGETQRYSIDISLPAIQSADYERPYVAVWLANKKNQPVKVLQLWYSDDRWLSDLKHFWRRVLRHEVVAVDGVAGATRGPGHYRFKWDGGGPPLTAGEYKLCAEAVREHGGHSAECIAFDPNYRGLSEAIEPQGEFIRLSIEAL